MRPRRRADSARASSGCTGSSTAPSPSGTPTQPVLPGQRTNRSGCLPGDVLGLGCEIASVPERTYRSSPRDLGPAGREIRRQSGTPAPPSPGANKAKAAIEHRRGTSQDRGSIRRRPGTAGRISPSGVPRRRFFVLTCGSSKTKRRHGDRDGVGIFTVPGRDVRTKSGPWRDRRN